MINNICMYIFQSYSFPHQTYNNIYLLYISRCISISVLQSVYKYIVFAEFSDILLQLSEFSLAVFLLILYAEGVQLALVGEGLVLLVHYLPLLL